MFLGIEIGGTKLQLGVGPGDGTIVEFERIEVNRSQGHRGILEGIEKSGSRLLRAHKVAGVGIGFGGPVVETTGRVVKSHQVEGWEDYPLVDWCQRTLGVPTRLGNDCDSAALAEARFGAGRGKRVVFYVTVGTGIGGGLAVDGQLQGVGRPAIAEIGHLRPGLNAEHAHVTVESIASGPGIESAVRARLMEDGNDPHGTSDLTGIESPTAPLTCQVVAQAAKDGNIIAREVLDSACQALGWAIAQVITLVAPEVVVVGGGVSMIGEQLFYAPVRRYVQQYIFPPLASTYQIVSPSLDELVVVHGAIARAAEKWDGRAEKNG